MDQYEYGTPSLFVIELQSASGVCLNESAPSGTEKLGEENFDW